MNIKDLQVEAHQIAVEHGWWGNKREIPELLMLVVSECSEALEEYRSNSHIVEPSLFGLELADIIIRVADMSQALGINLDTAITAKMDVNRNRPYRHGGKVC